MACEVQRLMGRSWGERKRERERGGGGREERVEGLKRKQRGGGKKGKVFERTDY